MTRFEVVERKFWQKISDPTIKASIYGSCPYTSEQDKNDWNIIGKGYNIKDKKENVIIGNTYPPYYWDKEKAEKICEAKNKRMALK
jgi:hypothetical protein